MFDQVSIIMPVYNGSQFIAQAIRSVLNQSYSNWELLVINDGSTDDTSDIVKSFRDKRITLFEKSRKGVSAARNEGLRKMKGDYYCFLDADDVLTSVSLESRIKVFKAEAPEVLFVDGSVEIFNQDFSKKIDIWQPKYRGNPFTRLIELKRDCFFAPTWLIKRVNNNQVFFNEKLSHGEDLFFFTQLSSASGVYAYTKEVILNYRKGHVSAMSNIKGLKQSHFKMLELIKEDFRIPFWPMWKRKIRLINFFRLKERTGVFQTFRLAKKIIGQ